MMKLSWKLLYLQLISFAHIQGTQKSNVLMQIIIIYYEFVFIRQNLKGDYLISVYREFASGLYNKISQLIEGKKVKTLGLTKNDQQ